MTAQLSSRHTLQYLQEVASKNPSALVVDEKANSRIVRTTLVRLAFAHLGEKGKNLTDPTKEGKFGANLLFLPGTDFSVMKKERDRLLAEKYPANPTGVGMKPAIRDQGEWVSPANGGKNAQGKDYKGFVPGSGVILPTANRQPTLWVPPIVNGQATRFFGTPQEIAAEFYSGCWCLAFLNVYGSSVAANPGVFFGLEGLLKVLDDDKFDGGTSAAMSSAAAFSGISVGQNEDPASFF